ncbi:hypothetical protein [Methylobacterium terrae]|nr:hypothetical protein [Methylobacterium terrae]
MLGHFGDRKSAGKIIRLPKYLLPGSLWRSILCIETDGGDVVDAAITG